MSEQCSGTISELNQEFKGEFMLITLETQMNDINTMITKVEYRYRLTRKCAPSIQKASVVNNQRERADKTPLTCQYPQNEVHI